MIKGEGRGEEHKPTVDLPLFRRSLPQMFPSLAPSLASLLHHLGKPPSSSSAASSSSSLFSQTELVEIQHIVEELKGVQKIWESVEAVLADAEERQIRDKSVRLWLRDLKDLADQIEDLRDVYEYDVVAWQVQSSMATSSSTSIWRRLYEFLFEVRPSVTITSLSPLADASYRNKIAADVIRIKKDFDSIAKLRKALRLKNSDGRKHSLHDGTMERLPTGQLVEDPVFLGRDRDLERVRDLLIAGHRGGDVNVEVIVVKGMGGVGKTTLTQHVSRDPDVMQNFDRIGWVHVSENFELVRLANAIVETFSGSGSNLTEFSSLQKEVSQLIEDNKVLLVMDDVWRIEQGWDSLIAPFHSAPRKGSKILVTTRLPEVANAVRAVDSVELGRLSEEDGWSLLKKRALPDQSNVVGNLEELEGMGKRIVERCGGLPLSIKLLGGILRCKENDEKEWRDVMESNLLGFSEGSEAEKEILGSLYLSYLYLPQKLKSCFKFCAAFPKQDIQTERLKRSWMVYDVVNDEKEASKRLHELQSRYFLEFDEYGCLHMHDHVYDLAKYVLGEEKVNLKYDDKYPVQLDETHFSSAQHASIAYNCSTANSHCRINATLTNLRTLELVISRIISESSISTDGFSLSELLSEVHLSPGRCIRELRIEASSMSRVGFSMELMSCDGCQYQLKCLRVLVLDGWCGSIPSWVSQLHSLRYLALRSFKSLGCDWSLDSVCNLRNLRWLIVAGCMIPDLPEAISRLTNMQELSLTNCLQISSLPKSISELVNLQVLNVHACYQISSLPKSISELVNLQVLNLHECQCLKELPEGIIKLTNLRVLDCWDTSISWMPRGIKALTKLEDLTFHVNSAHAGLAELEKMRYLQVVVITNLSDKVTEEEAAQAQIATKNYIRELHLRWSENAHDERLGHSLEKCILAMLLLLLLLHWIEYAREGHLDLVKSAEYVTSTSSYCGVDLAVPSYLLGLMLSKQAMFLLRKEKEERVARRPKQVLDRLRPHTTIEDLFISYYRGSTLPSWMGDGSFTRLVKLELSEVHCCASLSPIDQLPSLKLLWLLGMDSLKEVFPYQRNNGHDIGIMHPPTERRPRFFPKLKDLTIEACKSLRFLPLHKFSSLELVVIDNCCNLRSMEAPYGNPCCLKSINVYRCPKFQFSPDPRFPNPSWKLSYNYQ